MHAPQAAERKSPEQEFKAEVNTMLLQATAANSALGPLTLARITAETQLKHFEVTVEGFKSKDILDFSKAEHNMRELRSRYQQTCLETERAVERLTALLKRGAQLVGATVHQTTLDYEKVMFEADPDGSECRKMTEVAEGLLNTGPLEAGEVVTVARNGRMQKAKVVERVVERVGEDSYRLSIWTEITYTGQLYEAGFETQSPVFEEYLRSRLYAKAGKRRSGDVASAGAENVAAREVAELRARGLVPTDTRWLDAMYDNAERTNQTLKEEGSAVALEVNEQLKRPQAVHPKFAPLKGRVRVMAKVAEKYGGDFSMLGDLARMTFECDTMEAVTQTLKGLASKRDAVRITGIKNRLMAEFDTSSTGGYRDMLINCCHVATGHRCEVQITLSGLLAIKDGPGHAVYDVVRMLDLNDPSVTNYEGRLTPEVLSLVECGVVRKLVLRGESAGVREHFPALVRALSAETCFVHTLDLGGASFPDGTKLQDLLTPEVLECLKRSLVTFIASASTSIAGVIPDGLYDCARLQVFELDHIKKVSGEISSRVRDLRQLRTWTTWGTDMTSPDDAVAREIFGLDRLEHFEASDGEGSGVIYVSLSEGSTPHAWTKSLTGHPSEDGFFFFFF
jgi:hypothetical protein